MGVSVHFWFVSCSSPAFGISFGIFGCRSPKPPGLFYLANCCCLKLAHHAAKELALHHFHSMPLATLIPNVISYSASISACEKGAMWQAALALFHQMPKAKIHPNLHAHNATISSCEKGAQWHLALKIFGLAIATVTPDVVTFGATISACDWLVHSAHRFIVFYCMWIRHLGWTIDINLVTAFVSKRVPPHSTTNVGRWKEHSTPNLFFS